MKEQLEGKQSVATDREAVTRAFHDTEFSSVLYGALALCGFVFLRRISANSAMQGGTKYRVVKKERVGEDISMTNKFKNSTL